MEKLNLVQYDIVDHVPKNSYLNDQKALDRLLTEYKKYGSLTVAYDFDNTVYDYHNEGHDYSDVINLIRECKECGFYLIVFTGEENTNKVETFLNENDIPFDAINENPPFFKSTSRKIYSNILLDDRAGLYSAYWQLKNVINIIKYGVI